MPSNEENIKRSLLPLSEREILEILKKQDQAQGREPDPLSYAIFLSQLNTITEGHNGIVDTKKSAAIFNLRAIREGINEHPTYTSQSVRLRYCYGKKTLKPLTPDEQLEVFGNVIDRRVYLRLVDILTIPLGRWGKPLQPSHGTTHVTRKYTRKHSQNNALQMVAAAQS